MSCTQKVEPLCESEFPSTTSGCCADGRRCDDICIAIAAAQQCMTAQHTAATDDTNHQDRCCGESTTEPCSLTGKRISFDQLSSNQQDLFNTSNKTSCKLKQTTSHADKACKEGGDELPHVGRVTKDGCCTAKTAAPIKAEKCEASPSQGCCEESMAVMDKQVAEDSETSVAYHNTGPCTPAAQTENPITTDNFEEACSVHLAAAMEKYKKLLEAGICICRTVLSQVDICCDQEKRAAVSKKHKLSSATTFYNCSKETKSQICKPGYVKKSDRKKGCCASKSVNSCSDQEDCCDDSHNNDTACVNKSFTGYSDQGDCCDDICNNDTACANKSVTIRSKQKDCCDNDRNHDTACEPASNDLVTSTISLSKPKSARMSEDLEQSAAREHVIFGLTGMTCTGCVKKVLGVLNGVDGVKNVNVNFVTATGHADVDAAKISASEVLQRLEKETGFKISRIFSDYQTLDLDMPSTIARVFAINLPEGVESIEKVGKDVYRVTYDPQLVGARTVLARSGGSLAPPSKNKALSEGRRRTVSMLWSFSLAMLFTIPVCVLAFGSPNIVFLTKSITEFVLATFVQAVAVPEFYIPALKSLIFSRVIEMDMLVVISITAAYGYSIVAFGLEVSGVNLEQGPLFETSTLLITLVLLGRLVASYAKVRAVQAVSLKSLQADTALLEDAEGETTEIDGRLLEFGDVVRVLNHSKIVSDGQIINGESAVDESMLTGESLPVPKAVGDLVTAGTLNGPGVLRIRLTRLPGKNSITDIADLVQSALDSKPRIQDLADVVAGYFVPVVVTISIIVFAVWVAVALRIRNQGAGGSIGTAITYSIAVLAISCPCALGLAVPLVLVVAGGVAAQGGVVIKQADATERGFKATDVVFDKTGTLTTGTLEVMEQILHQGSFPADVVLAVTYSLVKDDTHPVAQAVAAELQSQGVSVEAVEAVESIPGCGVIAMWRGRQVKAGNPYWVGINGVTSIGALQAAGFTLLCITFDQQLVASFGLKATVRPEAGFVVRALQNRGLTCHIVSGDQPMAVTSVATSLGIDVSNAVSRQTPADKQTYIQNLKSAGKVALFIGDGTNDAVAIAAANIGVQIGAASDVTRATADVVLLGGLEGIITLLEVSRQSYYRIIFNFVWSGVYNLFAILLASGAFVKVRIAPNYAGLGEIVSVLPVVFAALTMLKVKANLSR